MRQPYYFLAYLIANIRNHGNGRDVDAVANKHRYRGSASTAPETGDERQNNEPEPALTANGSSRQCTTRRLSKPYGHRWTGIVSGIHPADMSARLLGGLAARRGVGRRRQAGFRLQYRPGPLG